MRRRERVREIREEKEMKKERKGKKKEKKERRKGKNEKGKGGWPAMAGGYRRRPELPEVAGVGRKGGQSNMWRGASVVKIEKLVFWKRGFGERSYSSLERE